MGKNPLAYVLWPLRFVILSLIHTYTDDFEVVFPDNGLFGVIEGGPSKVVADGFYIITEPLAKGNYPIHVKSSLICLDPDCVEPNFAVDNTYNITAK